MLICQASMAPKKVAPRRMGRRLGEAGAAIEPKAAFAECTSHGTLNQLRRIKLRSPFQDVFLA